jgi:hypothetical protein
MKNLTVFRLTIDIAVQKEGELLPDVATVANRMRSYLAGLRGGEDLRTSWFVNGEPRIRSMEELDFGK